MDEENRPVKKFPVSLVALGLTMVVFGVLALMGLVLVKNQKKYVTQRAVIVKPIALVTYFSLVSVSPSNLSHDNAPDTPVTLNFSEPVRPDSLRSYFTVSPMIPGDFSIGSTPNQVVFKAKYPFGSGTSVKVILNKGFQAVSGNTFTSDYTFNFYTRVLDNTVLFENQNVYSRWANLAVGQGITFNLHVGADVPADSVISVYKGSVDAILGTLVYKNEPQPDSNYVSQTYVDGPVDTTKMQKIYDSKGLKDGTTFAFNQNEGLYYVQATGGGAALGSTWINVTDQGLIARQDDQNITLAEQNIKTGNIGGDIKVSLYNLQDKPTLMASQNMTNYTVIPAPYPEVVDLVVGQTATGIILVPLAIPETQADIRVTSNLANMDRIYLTTDRPTYKQGDTVQFSGVVRSDNDAKFGLPDTGSQVRVWIQDPQNLNTKLVDQIVSVGPHGIISGQFVIPGNLANSSVIVYAKVVVNNGKYINSKYYTTFDVVSASNSGTLQVTFEKGSYFKNESVIAHVIGVDGNGQPMADRQITYSLYAKNYYENDPESAANFGADWGGPTKTVDQTATLDSAGKADITLSLDSSTTSEAVTFEATTSDANPVSGAKTILVQQGKLIVSFGSSRQNYKSGDTTLTRVYVKDLAGNPAGNLPLKYEIYNSNYDQANGNYSETSMVTGNTQTDGSGFSLISVPLTGDPGNYTIRVSGQDSAGNQVEAERTVSVVSDLGQAAGIYYHDLTLTNLDVATDKQSYTLGDTANLVINSPSDLNVFVTYESGRIYHNEWLKLNKGDNNYQINITPELAPSFNIVFSYFNNQSLFVEGLPFYIADQTRNLNLAVAWDKTSYTKNDTAVMTVTTGLATPSAVLVDVVDDSIFGLRDVMPSGNMAWFFYGPRIVTTNSSASTLGIGTGGGCGGGSGTDIKYVPNRLGSTVYWNPNLVTDQNGTQKVSIPLANASGKLRVFVTGVTDDTAIGQSSSQLVTQ